MSSHISLTELQFRLLRLRRELELEDQSSDAICAWCGNKKASHLADGRCSVFATSQYFTNKLSDKTAKVEKALELTEELLKLA